MQSLNSMSIGRVTSSVAWRAVVASAGRARRLLMSGCLVAFGGCAETPASPATTDRAALIPTAGAAGSADLAGGAANTGGTGDIPSGPSGPGPAVDGAALPDASQAWSVAELLSRTDLDDGEEVQVQGYATGVDMCKLCPAGARCAACFAQVALGDSRDPTAGPLVSIVGPFIEGTYDFAVGQRLVFRGQFRSRTPSLRAAAAELRYLSYATLEAAP